VYPAACEGVDRGRSGTSPGRAGTKTSLSDTDRAVPLAEGFYPQMAQMAQIRSDSKQPVGHDNGFFS
jgi:hypothetical protein